MKQVDQWTNGLKQGHTDMLMSAPSCGNILCYWLKMLKMWLSLDEELMTKQRAQQHMKEDIVRAKTTIIVLFKHKFSKVLAKQTKKNNNRLFQFKYCKCQPQY